MLCVTLRAAGARFAIPARDILEVAPLVELAPLPGAPPYVAGLMNLRGRSIPVADLTVLLAGRPSRRFASTRILCAATPEGLAVGLMAERVLKTLAIDPDAVAPPGAPAAPWVTGVAGGEELVQILDVARVLPPELLRALSRTADAPDNRVPAEAVP
ncbi:hypothetical protein NNJEOMEG_00933 [Fundidesulfovibrio magnetotacticus]|uniref:CheW-like domain-containing protein n=1 Tax=Fundidesulfovibrio magnetotacticus TaxID=2730080 RepID=A0A6V8LN66_9BACT|nr:chemotaxis protein CheW [Fundidesulfovibrio magnetotacticus]GFK93104.1 hypothetical protein NNJEOMEG_00933 [Fundidesulfovibrio magnetotacticus]